MLPAIEPLKAPLYKLKNRIRKSSERTPKATTDNNSNNAIDQHHPPEACSHHRYSTWQKQRDDSRKEEERARKVIKSYFGGIAWGFDPTAGVRLGEQERFYDEGCYIFPSGSNKADDFLGRAEYDQFGRCTGRR